MITLIISLVGIVGVIMVFLFIAINAWNEPIPEPKDRPDRTPADEREIKEYCEMIAEVHMMTRDTDK